MSSKADLQRKLNEIGYELSPFTSKDTLLNILRLHAFVLTDKHTNVAVLNDLELRRSLIRHGLLVGPVTNHTRSIYQRKLLEVLTNQTIEGEGYETDESNPDINDENTLYPSLSNDNSLYPSLSDQNSFSYDGPMVIRNDYKATTSTRNTFRDRNLYDDSNEIRSRISTKSNEQQPIKINKVNVNDKLQVATKSGGRFVYIGITIIVALIVFVLYFLV